MIKKLLHSERGSTTIMALAFMALAIPVVTASLSIASTLSIGSRVGTETLKDQYSALGASQHSIYRLAYETGYADGLATGVPNNYTITLNGEEVTVVVVKLSDTSGEPPPPRADSSRTLQVIKEVTPTVAAPNILTSFTYTITVENRGDKSKKVTKIEDELPPGFTYIALSTGGVTSADPGISGQSLTWNLGGSGPTLEPGQSATLTFDADASVAEGNYCNEAWVDPGGTKTSTGKTARVQVGSPANTLCSGPAVEVTKTVNLGVVLGGTATTYTYTITIENIGTAVLNMSKIRDLLPPGFLYVPGSTSGNITSAAPSDTMWQGSQRLDWTFNPDYQIQPGETKTLTLDTTASVSPGDYYNEAWVTLDEVQHSIYTWPTALVEVMSAMDTTAAAGVTTAASEVWVGTDSYVINRRNITR